MNKLNFFTVATLILGTLKLLGYVDWSWTWVLAPAALSIAVELAVSSTSLVVFLRNRRRNQW